MKRLAALAIVFSCFAFPAFAQHGGSHAGFGGHAGSSFHGGFGAMTPGRGFASPRMGSTRSTPFSRNSGAAAARMFRTRPPYAHAAYAQRANAQSEHHRVPYRPTYGRDHHRYGYGWSGYPLWSGWAAPWIPDYPLFYGDDFDEDDSSQAAYGVAPTYPDDPGEQDAAQYPDQGPYASPYGSPYPAPYGSGDQAANGFASTPGAPYRPSSQLPQQPRAPYRPSSSSAGALSAAAPEVPITVIFKNGRPPETIHNYLLTATTLSVLDQHRQDIPVDQIDVAATARVNREAGSDFEVPPPPRP